MILQSIHPHLTKSQPYPPITNIDWQRWGELALADLDATPTQFDLDGKGERWEDCSIDFALDPFQIEVSRFRIKPL